MRILKIISAIILLTFSGSLFAQQVSFSEIIKNKENKIVFAKLENKEVLLSSLPNDLSLIKQLTNHPSTVEYKFERMYSDNAGFTHKVYKAYFQNIEVIGLDYTIHIKEGKIKMANGDFADLEHINIKPILTKETAYAKAIGFFKNTKILSPESKNTDLVICKDILLKTFDYRLCYRVLVVTENRVDDKYIYVDAITGEIIRYQPLVCTTNAPGTAETRYSGTQGFTTDLVGAQYRLREVRNGVNIITLNNNNSNDETGFYATDFWDNDNNWTAAEHGINQPATDAHWGTEKVFDYWLNQHNRNSINNAGMDIRSYVHVRNNFDNAYWHPTFQSMYYGDGGTSFRPLTSLDVTAHELGHGVCQFTSNLDVSYGTESSAMNEGFSDIWGASVEAWAAPNKQRWLIAEEITLVSPYYLRSMSNPKTGLTKPSPDCYNGQYWNSDIDAHYRSGVLNKWYYLLTEGGSGTNDLGNAYNVQSVGITNAARIAYLTEQLLNASADYAMGRTMSVQAAINIFGQNSCEQKSIENAWFAVGVGNASTIPTTTLSLTITGGINPICSGSSTYTLNGAPTGSTINWIISNTSIARLTSNGNQATVTKTGSGSLTLIATVTGGCYINNSASKTIQLGAYSNYDVTVAGPYQVPLNYTTNFSVDLNKYGDLSNLMWSWPAGWSCFTGCSYSSSYVVLRSPSTASTGNINLTFSACGVNGILASKWVAWGYGGPRYRIAANSIKGTAYRVSPNPANDILRIEQIDGNIKGLIRTNIQMVEIVNKMGLVVYRQTFIKGTQNGVTIPVAKLRRDVYTVRIYDGKEWKSEKIIILH